MCARTCIHTKVSGKNIGVINNERLLISWFWFYRYFSNDSSSCEYLPGGRLIEILIITGSKCVLEFSGANTMLIKCSRRRSSTQKSLHYNFREIFEATKEDEVEGKRVRDHFLPSGPCKMLRFPASEEALRVVSKAITISRRRTA